MKKKLFFVLTIACLCVLLIGALTASAATVASGNCGTNLAWTLDDTGTLTISGTGDMDNYFNTSDVPWYNYKESITSVVILENVRSIGINAFDGCSNLTNITIPNSVGSMGSSAFKNCSSLTSITIPDSVTIIDSYAFYGC